MKMNTTTLAYPLTGWAQAYDNYPYLFNNIVYWLQFDYFVAEKSIIVNVTFILNFIFNVFVQT